jgi:hypothetical protein
MDWNDPDEPSPRKSDTNPGFRRVFLEDSLGRVHEWTIIVTDDKSGISGVIHALQGDEIIFWNPGRSKGPVKTV